MSNWQKWADRPAYDPTSERLVCVLLRSRNKDNRDVPGFHERRHSRLVGLPMGTDPRTFLQGCFRAFVDEGLPGEMSRLYVSVNARDNSKVRKALLERLIFDDSASMASLPSLLCGLAADHACAAERRWMFDFDPERGHDDRALVAQFAREVAADGGFLLDDVEVHETPHGYAVVVPHGFDVRGIMSRWSSVATLKRDDLLCVDWACRGD